MNLVEKISLKLILDKKYLSHIVSNSSYYYKEFTISKQNGGKRYIAHPSAELKTLQYWVLRNILDKIPVSRAACAYNKGNSIKKHAQMHSQSRFIFKTDIKNFFPSIHSSRLNNVLELYEDVFEKLELDFESSLKDLNNICFRWDSLCVGAVSSPRISNIIMYDFDNTLIEHCEKMGYVYSRYADDIYISSNNYISEDLKDYVALELNKIGFEINYKKTKFISTKHRRRITGLILSEKGKVTIGLERRNKIKKMIYDKLVNGKGDSKKILGYLSFLKDIEPNTYNNLIIKYSKYCDGDIILALNK